MKKTKMTQIASIVGIIAIVAMIGLGLSACGGNGDNGGTHTHTYSTTWSSSATQHWKECTDASCDAKTQTANHTPADGVCTTCQYDNTPPHTCTYVYTVTSTSYPAQSIQTCSCGETTGTARNTEIGDTGPAGGIIFYVVPSGFTVQGYTGTTGSFAEYTAYYMEAAPANESVTPQWGEFGWGALGTFIDDVTTWANATEKDAGLAESIGYGRRDTQIIVNYLATTEETYKAAQLCANKTVTVGGKEFNDWFLPSLGELNEMYEVITDLGISSGGFWSSSQNSGERAWYLYIGNGYQGDGSKYNFMIVRAVRAF